MWTFTQWDDSVYEKVDLPCTEAIRRETRIPGLITVRGRMYPSWLYGLREGNRFIIMGVLCSEDETSRWPSRSDMHRIVRSVTKFVDRNDLRFKAIRRNMEVARRIEEDNHRWYSGVHGIYRHLNRKKGSIRAERWLKDNGLDTRSLTDKGFAC